MALHVSPLSGHVVLYSSGSSSAVSVCGFCGRAGAGSVWGSRLALVLEAEAVAVQAAEFPW